MNGLTYLLLLFLPFFLPFFAFFFLRLAIVNSLFVLIKTNHQVIRFLI